MRTKHLLTALALPALFAACTADEIESVGVATQERAVLSENFNINFGGVESRLTAGAPNAGVILDFEAGDKVGGAIMDTWTGTTFTPVEFVSSNHPFVFDGSKWNIEHTMVEGNYLFYYPYNEGNNSRGAVHYSIPVTQELAGEDGKFAKKAAIENYSMFVGHQELDKKDLSASCNLQPIYGYARLIFTLDNAFAGGNVVKIALQAGDTEYFNLNGQLSNTKIRNLFVATEDMTEKEAEEYMATYYNTTASFSLDAKINGEGQTQVDNPFYVADLNKASKVMVATIPGGTALTADAQGNKSFETYMVVPAQSFTKTITAYMYMADGRVFSGDVEVSQFNRNKIKKVEVMLEKAASEPKVITSVEDWNTYAAEVKSTDTNVEFVIASDDFALVNGMKYPAAPVAVKGNLVVEGDNVTASNITAESVVIAEGAKLTTGANFNATEITIEGELVIAKNAVNKDGNIIAYSITEIINESTLTINEGAVAAFKLTNEEEATVVNAGEITITGENYGLINNEGSINIEAAGFENKAREYEEVKVSRATLTEWVVVNEPTIDNKATGEIRATAGKLTNKSKIVNAGILSCGNNAGTIENNTDGKNPGLIDSKANSITLISDNTNGKIVVYGIKQANTSVNKADGQGIIEYTANANITIDESYVTDVVAAASITITQGSDATKNGKLKNLKVAADATITVTAPEANAKTFTSIEVAEGKKLTLGSNITTASLKVNKNASVIVPKNMTLKVTAEEASFTNNGSIVVTGTLLAESVKQANGGLVLDNGGTGSIKWELEGDKLTLSTAKTAYETAMKAAVKEYAENAAYNLRVFDYNLNDTITEGAAGEYGAQTWFERVVKNTGSALETKTEVYKNYTAYLNAFVKVNPNATDAQKPKFLDYYASAVTNYITTVEATAAYTADLKDYKIAVPTASANEVNFFVETKRQSVLTATTATDNVTVSAETNALNAFKAKIVADNTLDVATKVVLCSEGTYSNISSYIPEYVFAFESNNAYKLWKNYIAKNQSTWNIPTTLSGFTAWVKGVADWTEEVLKTKGADEKLVHAFIIDNNYAVYLESKNWKYTDRTIAEMLSFANEELNITVTTQP